MRNTLQLTVTGLPCAVSRARSCEQLSALAPEICVTSCAIESAQCRDFLAQQPSLLFLVDVTGRQFCVHKVIKFCKGIHYMILETHVLNRNVEEASYWKPRKRTITISLVRKLLQDFIAHEPLYFKQEYLHSNDLFTCEACTKDNKKIFGVGAAGFPCRAPEGNFTYCVASKTPIINHHKPTRGRINGFCKANYNSGLRISSAYEAYERSTVTHEACRSISELPATIRVIRSQKCLAHYICMAVCTI